MTTLVDQNFIQIRDLITELDHIPNYERFPYNIFDECDMPKGDAYSSGYLVPSHLGIAYVLKLLSALFGHFFNLFNYFLWLRITDEGSIPEMRIWSILLIKSALN